MKKLWIAAALAAGALGGGAALGWAHGAGDSVHLQCERPVGETLRVTVNGGRAYAAPGEAFGFDVERLQLNRCQPVEVTFVNHDAVRHAFMVDGLSPAFMIELAGQGRATATFVAPDEDATLMLHCHVPGHDRAGMMGAVVVGAGDVAQSAPGTGAPWAGTSWVVLGLRAGLGVRRVGAAPWRARV